MAALLPFFRSLVTCHLLGEAFPNHSFYSSHTPALIIHPLSAFFHNIYYYLHCRYVVMCFSVLPSRI